MASPPAKEPAIIGRNPVVRIIIDQGISGYGEAESAKP